jgi:hypothetical protein
MRPFVVLLLVLDILLGIGFGCSSPPREPQVSGPLGVVRFPEPWVKWKGDAWVGVNDNIQYVTRRTSKGQGGSELLFAVKQGFDGNLFGKEVYDFPVKNPDYDYYSDDRFAVSLDKGGRVRKVTAVEWDAAEKLLHSFHFIKSFENPQVTVEGVKYKDRLYSKSGESWGNEVALVSPRSTWIAVFSFTSREKPQESLIPASAAPSPPTAKSSSTSTTPHPAKKSSQRGHLTESKAASLRLCSSRPRYGSKTVTSSCPSTGG